MLSFPFSDLRTTKVRPVIALSSDNYNRRSEDFVGVPVTSNLKLRDYAILLTNDHMEKGELLVQSKVKVDRVFSVSQRLVRTKIGRVKPEVHKRIIDTLLDLLR